MDSSDYAPTLRPTPDDPARSGERVPERIGKFVLRGKLGAGGMGEVWEARDTELDRAVALKLMHGDEPAEAERFRREAQLAARLSHPNIAAIYEVGSSGGRPYIAMQLVDGTTLRAFKKKNVETSARLVRDAARAVQYAHELGIVHRDLKPDNIMESRGRVFVMDFGLARTVQGGSRLSVSGTLVGTPSYMPPEQARGERADARADVYALGATLYELLDGRPPFAGDNIYDTLLDVLNTEPVPPRAPRDLETIVLKCLEKQPAARYATAAELADDLDRFLDREPIAARPVGPLARLGRRLVRRKLLVAAVALLLALVPTVLLLVRARSSAGRAEEALTLWTDVSRVLADAEIHLRQGEVGAGRRKIDDGLKLCRAAPESAHARYFAGRLLAARDDRDGAIAELDRAVALDASFAAARFERGLHEVDAYVDLYSHRELTTPAAAPAATRDEVERAFPDVADLRRRALDDLGVPPDGRYYVAADLAYARAQLARMAGDLATARRTLEALLRDEPLHVRAAVALVQVDYAEHAWDASWRRVCEQADRHRGSASVLLTRVMLAVRRQAETPHDREVPEWLATAHRDIERVIELRGRTAKTLGWRAIVRRVTGDPSGAVEDATAAIAMEPGGSLAVMTRAIARAQAGDLDGALADARLAVGFFPRAASAPMLLGNVLGDRGDREGARAAYDRAIAMDARYAAAYVNRGSILDESDPERALADYARALEIYPRYYEALTNRGNLLMRMGRHAEALRDHDAAVAIAPRSAGALHNRANARSRAGDVAGALEDCARGADLAPTSVIERLSRAQLESLAGSLDTDAARALDFRRRALADCDEVVRLSPGLADARLVRARVRIHLGQHAAAREDAEKAVELSPHRAEAHELRGLALRHLGNLAGAREAYDRAIALAATPERHRERARLRIAAQDLEGARRDYDDALRLDPKDAVTWSARAAVRGTLRDFEGTVADATESIRLDPRFAHAWHTRAQARYALGRYEESEADFGEAVRLDPRNAEAWISRGALREMRGDRKGALGDYRAALGAMPQDHPRRPAVEQAMRALERE